MNFVAYNLYKYRKEYKISIKEISSILNVSKKTIYQWEKEKDDPTEEQIKILANLFHVDYLSFSNESFETIDLRKKKIYGTNYTYLKYHVIECKRHIFPLISFISDILVVIFLLLCAILKKLPIEEGTIAILTILRFVFLIELFVTPLLFIALPALKLYFNRSYIVSIDTKVLKDNKEEIEGIVESQLVKNIHKNIFLSMFTIISQLLFVIYFICYMIDLEIISVYFILFLVFSLVSIILSIINIMRYYKYYPNKVEANNIN